MLAACSTEGQELFGDEALVRLTGEVGLDADEVMRVLAGTDYAQAVQSVVDRTYGVSGAQPAASLLQGLDQAWAASHPLGMATTTCGPLDGHPVPWPTGDSRR